MAALDGATIRLTPERISASVAERPVYLRGVDLATHRHATAEVDGLDAALAGKMPTQRQGLHLLDFGDPDLAGGADATAILQAALDAAALTGRTLRLPAGVLSISDTLRLNGHVRVVGEAAGIQYSPQNDATGVLIGSQLFAGSFLRLADGAAALRGWSDPQEHAMLRVHYDNANYVSGYADRRRMASLEHIGLDGNAAGQAGGSYSCILQYGAWNLAVERCIVNKPRGYGIASNLGPATSVNNLYVRRCWIFGDGANSLRGIYSESGDSQLIQNDIAFWADAGIYSIAGASVASGNKVWYNERGVFLSSNVSAFAWGDDNIVYDNDGAGIYVSGTTGTGSRLIKIGGLVVNNGQDTALAATERVGIRMVGDVAGILLDGLTLGNRPAGAGQTASAQQYGVRVESAAADVTLGSVASLGHAVADISNPNGTVLKAHAGGTATATFAHPGFTATGDIAMGGNTVANALRLLAGTGTAQVAAAGTTPAVQASGTGGSSATLGAFRYSADNGSANVVLAKSRGATVGAHAAPVAGDILGAVAWQYSDGAAFQIGAQVRGVAASATSHEIGFWTASGGTLAERGRVRAAGGLDWYGPLQFRPAATASPAANGDLVFEATSDTALTIRLRGADGVVRSATLALT